MEGKRVQSVNNGVPKQLVYAGEDHVRTSRFTDELDFIGQFTDHFQSIHRQNLFFPLHIFCFTDVQNWGGGSHLMHTDPVGALLKIDWLGKNVESIKFHVTF